MNYNYCKSSSYIIYTFAMASIAARRRWRGADPRAYAALVEPWQLATRQGGGRGPGGRVAAALKGKGEVAIDLLLFNGTL
jgi:hypothetical protein